MENGTNKNKHRASMAWPCTAGWGWAQGQHLKLLPDQGHLASRSGPRPLTTILVPVFSKPCKATGQVGDTMRLFRYGIPQGHHDTMMQARRVKAKN